VQHLELPALDGDVLWLGHGAEHLYDFEGLAQSHTVRIVGECSVAASTGRVHDVWRTGDWREGQRIGVKRNIAGRVAGVELDPAGRARQALSNETSVNAHQLGSLIDRCSRQLVALACILR